MLHHAEILKTHGKLKPFTPLTTQQAKNEVGPEMRWDQMQLLTDGPNSRLLPTIQ